MSARGEGFGWGKVALRLVVTLVVLGAAYVGLAYYLGSHVPSGTTVQGVDIGGMTEQRAADTLRSALSDRASEPVTLTVVDDTVDIDPERAGLSLDIPATLDGLTGVTFDPGLVWQHLTGSGEQQPLEVDVDDQALEQQLRRVARDVHTKAREGSIRFDDGRVVTTLPRQGRSLDVSRTAEQVAKTWPRQSQITASVEVTEPELSKQQLKKAVRHLAKPAVSGSVTVRSGKHHTRLTPTQLGRMLSVHRAKDGTPELRLDGTALAKQVRDQAPRMERDAVNATVRLVDGHPRVIPGRYGRQLRQGDLHDSVLKAVRRDHHRVARVGTHRVSPKVSTKDARKWGVDEVISSFRSQFPTAPSDAARTHNIRTALRHINGTLVKPGEQFSLIGILGKTTKAKGYVKAPVIEGGRLTYAYGGGISQVSTTVWNAAWFAGVQLDEHTAHSYYIPRYPAGREATMWVPTIDNKWTNDTGHAILIQTHTEGDEVVMKFWGTDVYTVKTHTGPRRNIVEPDTVVDHDGQCIPQYPMEGFDISVTRVVKRHGEVLDRHVFTTHYEPEDRVVCAG
ncbi:MAG TPA: VanW family protein [Segeticoccus sp.]|jgi:vancomycin resistance protein YoaR|nr:VanW family protein [Segeticoccus sp.]